MTFCVQDIDIRPNSPYLAINSVYINKYKEWEFKVVPKNFWRKEKSIEAIKWLIEEKIRLSDKDLKEQLSRKLFKDNGLSGMLQISLIIVHLQL
ncbi:hypothetical protein [Clostridium sp. D43t1_170807_H7]|uniref:hypothetical protein n=1 Tax=Clostridium sp. D43t1_170807_H7 TaxID=2787140 RepID=UPI00189C2594|nr:hypothetical protein [Clostridium sp. D43t1_170807_H7]